MGVRQATGGSSIVGRLRLKTKERSGEEVDAKETEAMPRRGSWRVRSGVGG